MTKPIKNNSQLLYLQARQLFEQAKTKFEDGTIKSEPLLVASVFNSFQEFFTSMGKPNLVPRYAPEEGPPWSEDYNSMMNELKADLELLFQEVDILGRSLYSDFNHNMVQHDILMKQYETVLDKMRDLELYSGLNTDNRVEFGRDDFLNKNKIDYARISGAPLELVDGAVTLPQVSRENVAQNASVTIIAGNRKANTFIIGTESNGFPGNNTEIHSVTDDVLTNKNYIPTFLGEENNHSDYSVVLDGSPNTWFEYEKVNVREHDKVRVAKNLGWDYQVHENQTIPWAEDPENGMLKLHMQLVLPEEKVINQINCNMYTPPNYGAKTAIVKNILVSDGKGVPKSVLPKDKKDDQYSFHFEPVKAKVISVLFEQPHKYITDIGHLFYEKKMQTEDNSEYAMDMATKKYKYAPRVEGPLISLEDLGIDVKVSDSHVEAQYKLLTSNDQQAHSIGETINRLTNAVDMETVDMGVEKFEGFRWAIGIRDIEVFASEYATEGELVTTPFYFDKPMDKISLDVSENIPPVFASNDALKYDWLKYYVSIDDGATWHPITPLTQEVLSPEQPPKIYTVKMVESSEQRMDWKTDYIESEYPVYSIRMKVVARRPEDYTPEGFMLKDGSIVSGSFTQSSPVLSSYSFLVETAIDPADSEESDRIAANINHLGDGGAINPGMDEPPINNDGWPPGAGGSNPWGDDDGDGIPNWDDPDHPDYIPPSDRPVGGGHLPGNPGVYPDYPADGGSNPGSGSNEHPKLAAVITNKKTEWCSDEDLIVKGQIYGPNPLDKAELYLNNVLLEEKSLSGNMESLEFHVGNHHLVNGSMTFVLKGYDTKGMALDSDVLNIISCEGIPEEDRPQDRDADKLTIVVDKKPSELCECDNLEFYGSVQGPNQIQSITFAINGISVDPQNLGEAPADDPCGAGIASFSQEAEIVSLSSKSASKLSDEELLKIESFGEWLEAFEEREDCGCRNKKRQAAPMFNMQTTPFHMLQINEQTFQVSIPYWKIRSLEIGLNTTMSVSVKAVDSFNQEATQTFDVQVKDCKNPPVDENGNPRVRDCLELESIEVHYYDHEAKGIVNKAIPKSALPYSGISNGAGSGVTVGWRNEEKAPVIMQTSGYDDSGYAFQIHAVGIHYLNEYDQSKSKWSYLIGNKSPGVKNAEKMTGDPSRSSTWTEDMENGDYSTSPSLGGINDYAVFLFDNEWISNSCMMAIPNFEPTDHEQPEEPAVDPDRTPIQECNQMTHVVFQYFDEITKQLKMYKVDITSSGKDTYTLATKTGLATLTVGWVNYFKGPVIQIKTATGSENVLLTAIGLVYTDLYGDAQTAWSTQLRYKTNGVRYPEFAVGEKKVLSNLSWVQNGTVDYSQATYIGKQGDMVAYVIDSSITDLMCEAEKPVDQVVGVDPSSPPDVPVIEFTSVESTICIEEETKELHAIGRDIAGLKEVEYSIEINGVTILGPYLESIRQPEYAFTFPVETNTLQPGDTIILKAKVTNLFDVSVTEQLELLAENCVPPTPEPTAPDVPCGQTATSGGTGVTVTMHPLGSTPGTVKIDYNMYGAPDSMDVYYQDKLVASTNGLVANTGSLSFPYNPTNDVYEIKVIITGGSDGTAWDYIVNCPV